MMRVAQGLWLAAVVLACVYLAFRFDQGISFQSNILALLPRSQWDLGAQRAQDKFADALSHRVVFLVGDPAAEKAEQAARKFSRDLVQSGLVTKLTSKASGLEKIGAAYFPYRGGLLSVADRDTLLAGNEQRLVDRALAMIYAPGGIADARLIARDPFLLFPQYLMSLPVPQSRLAPDGDLLTVRDRGLTYVLVSAELAGDPYALAFQDRFNAFVAQDTVAMTKDAPNLKLLRTGALFYAAGGAHEAMDESSFIGFTSLAATLGLIFLVFRSQRPILLSFLAIGIGILTGFAGTLALFGEIHVIALLFGVSLIGIATDYCLQYFCEYFDPEARTSNERLARVFPGIAVGILSTLIGYFALLLAPIPGLREVAVFSLIGLAGSVLTVLLWFPTLDVSRPPVAAARALRLAALHWSLWESPSLRWLRVGLVVAAIVLGALGFMRLTIDDDVRHLQSLPQPLVAEEHAIEKLTGYAAGAQFLLVRGSTNEAVLETEERATDRLAAAHRDGLVQTFTAISQFVPSAARQESNRTLVRRLYPYQANYLAQIGYQGAPDPNPSMRAMTAADLPPNGPLAVLPLLDVSSDRHPAHIILLGGVTNREALAARTADTSGVRLISLADQWTALFGEYRRYAILLLALSVLLMYPLFVSRYGFLRGAKVLMPSLAAVALTPPLVALMGIDFTFFSAMALVLVLSVGVDYAVFCNETMGARKPITSLAIALAAVCTILSFGMLAFSGVFAVHAFGATMFVGILLAFLFAPASGDGRKREGLRA